MITPTADASSGFASSNAISIMFVASTVRWIAAARSSFIEA